MLAHTKYLSDPRVRREAEALAEDGIDIHVICLSEEHNGVREPRNAVFNKVQIHRLPVDRRRGGLLRYCFEYFMTGCLGAFQLARLQFQGRLRVVHIHNMPDMLVLAAFIPLLGGSKLVLDVHDPMPELYMSWGHRPQSLLVRLIRLQERLSCRLADRVISVNETMREQLEAKGVSREKIFIVNNFPDLNHFPQREAPTAWPKSDRLVLLYCGTVTEHYDLELAVKAIAVLAKELPVRLKIIGDGNRLSNVLQLGTSLGVRDAIEVFGKLPIENVATEMGQADVGVSCHRAGVFGDLYFSTKIVEYITQALPVVSSRTYTITRYLPDDCLFYFEPGNAKALADTIRYMLTNPGEVLRRLNNARALLSRLSWQTEKAKLSGFYANLLHREYGHVEGHAAYNRDQSGEKRL
jgi:glycosyltransferase involved in cell wall biosynthesis